ncbi:ABC transporter ATP-binding protein [Paenibacillus sp. YIM B09110]|uniref:ABC transporter ATP-binding protein n=1 Tax=Paenibacillus sp. YIM B09110 TaxID=3126102 RepID=UPI00301CE57F
MGNTDIEVNSVSMKFRLANEKVDSLKEFILRRLKRNMNYTDFYALNSVDFSIKKGERVGIIGHNGAGKSTLLKIISGVMKPTEGNVKVNGSVAPLLELGAGFDNDLTGAENIYLNSATLGKSKQYINNKYDEIVEYSGLEDFIHTPVKNYSSGMRARLGFSIATRLEPDILIVDEILGVGDEQFRKKSTETMKRLMNSGKTVITVSHSLSMIREMTDTVIWLHKGQIREIGNTEEVCNAYSSLTTNI